MTCKHIDVADREAFGWQIPGWLVPVVWTVIVSLSLGWNIYEVRQKILEIAVVQARTAYEKDVIYRKWNSGHGGVYVPVSENTPPNPYLSQVDERDIKTPSGRPLTLVNPAYMTRQVHEMTDKTGTAIHGHITSLKPVRPENIADDWEAEALRAFERGAKEKSSIEFMGGAEYMRLIKPLVTEESCLKCHSVQGYKKGDIRGGMSVSIPMAPLWAIYYSRVRTLIVWHLLLWGSVMAGIMTVSRRLKRSERGRRHAFEGMQSALEVSRKTETEISSLLESSRAILQHRKFNDAAKAIFESCRRLIGADSGYVAVLNEDSTANVVLHLDPGGHPCTVAPSLPMPVRGLRAEAYNSGKAVYHNGFSDSQWASLMPEGHVMLENVLFAPIMVDGKAAGLIGLANKAGGFVDDDCRIVSSFAELASIAYVNCRRLELLEQSREDIRNLNAELESRVISRTEDLKMSEARLNEYVGELLALADSSNAVSAISLSENIYESICNIAVREFGLKMAWMGLIVEADREVRPVAQSGFDDGYLSGIKITWDDSPSGFGPTGKAIKIKGPVIVHNMDTDPDYAPWRQEALKRGYRSSMALPLFSSEGAVFGVINLYSDKPEFFHKKKAGIFLIYANHASTVIENRSLVEDIIEKSRRLDSQLKAISLSHKQWQDTFDSITDMISIHDADFNIVRANKAFTLNFGLNPSEVVNRKCYELFHGFDCPPAECPHKKSLEENRTAAVEFQDIRSDRIFSITTFPYRSDEEGFTGSIHVAKDITEDRDRDMRLIMSERLASLGQMASGIAHEINNPLASISGCAEGLLKSIERNRFNTESAREYLGIIIEEIGRCKNITTGMLSFVRKSSYEVKDVDVNAVISKTLEIIGFQGRLHDVEVIKSPGDGLPRARISEGDLRQVMLSIVVNALDAMEDRGALYVTTGLDAGAVYIIIADTGPGIPDEYLRRIFDPFFTTKSDKGGTGLGLSIANRIVTENGGFIAAGPREGGGASFRITLPV